VFKIIKGEVRKRGEGRPIFSFNFMVLVVVFWLQQVLEPRYQTTLHDTQTRQDSRSVT